MQRRISFRRKKKSRNKSISGIVHDFESFPVPSHHFHREGVACPPLPDCWSVHPGLPPPPPPRPTPQPPQCADVRPEAHGTRPAKAIRETSSYCNYCNPPRHSPPACRRVALLATPIPLRAPRCAGRGEQGEGLHGHGHVSLKNGINLGLLAGVASSSERSDLAAIGPPGPRPAAEGCSAGCMRPSLLCPRLPGGSARGSGDRQRGVRGYRAGWPTLRTASDARVENLFDNFRSIS